MVRTNVRDSWLGDFHDILQPFPDRIVRCVCRSEVYCRQDRCKKEKDLVSFYLYSPSGALDSLIRFDIRKFTL